MKRLMRTLFGKPTYTPPKFELWRREEEERQIREVRERLNRVAEQVEKLDRRREPRVPLT